MDTNSNCKANLWCFSQSRSGGCRGLKKQEFVTFTRLSFKQKLFKAFLMHFVGGSHRPEFPTFSDLSYVDYRSWSCFFLPWPPTRLFKSRWWNCFFKYMYSTMKHTVNIGDSTLNHKCPGKLRDIIDAIIIRKTISGPWGGWFRWRLWVGTRVVEEEEVEEEVE